MFKLELESKIKKIFKLEKGKLDQQKYYIYQIGILLDFIIHGYSFNKELINYNEILTKDKYEWYCKMIKEYVYIPIKDLDKDI